MSDNERMARIRHPLVVDRETKLFRPITHEDVVRWERMEVRYNNLLETLATAIRDIEDTQ